jgi:hypothetical protein
VRGTRRAGSPASPLPDPRSTWFPNACSPRSSTRLPLPLLCAQSLPPTPGAASTAS